MNSTGVKQKLEEMEVEVLSGNMILPGSLAIPAAARGMVLFAHGSGSSRYSPRNRFVARMLHEHGLATLLFDLLTPEEEVHDRISAHLRFDIELLTKRLVGATDWAEKNPATRNLQLGYFGASTGAAAALVAAAQRGEEIVAVVSRGGRPDMAGAALERVSAATLLIVGGEDTIVLDLNREALAALGCVHKKLTVVPGATHLFEEPGALEKAGRAAAEWFERYLGAEIVPAAN